MPRAPFDAEALLTAALRGERGACGAFPIRIDRDGAWYYRGSRIDRAPLVKLFASVLHRAADGSHWLITPGEQGRIEVDDVAFTAVELKAEGAGPADQRLSFRTNLDEWVSLDTEHPLRIATDPTGGPIPYLRVRGRLEARLVRPVYYELVELAVPEREDGSGPFGVWSGGAFWPLGALDD